MRSDSGARAIDGRARPHRCYEGTRRAGGDKSFARAVNGPAIVRNGAAGDQRFDDAEWHESGAFPPDFSGRRRRPQVSRRRDEQRVALKRETGAEAHRGFGRANSRIEPFLERAEPRHRARDSRVQRIAVIDAIDPVAITGVGSDAPGPGGPQPNEEAGVHVFLVERVSDRPCRHSWRHS